MFDFVHNHSYWLHQQINRLRLIWIGIAICLLGSALFLRVVDVWLTAAAFGSLGVSMVVYMNRESNLIKHERLWFSHLLRFYWRTPEGPMSLLFQICLTLAVGVMTFSAYWHPPPYPSPLERYGNAAFEILLLQWGIVVVCTWLFDLLSALSVRRWRRQAGGR